METVFERKNSYQQDNAPVHSPPTLVASIQFQSQEWQTYLVVSRQYLRSQMREFSCVLNVHMTEIYV